jgi:hypothetical protein
MPNQPLYHIPAVPRMVFNSDGTQTLQSGTVGNPSGVGNSGFSAPAWAPVDKYVPNVFNDPNIGVNMLFYIGGRTISKGPNEGPGY